MTEYKCKRGFKIDIPEEMCHRKRLVSIVNAEIRAFCAFCVSGDVLVVDGDARPELVIGCDFLRADLSWDDFQEREEE